MTSLLESRPVTDDDGYDATERPDSVERKSSITSNQSVSRRILLHQGLIGVIPRPSGLVAAFFFEVTVLVGLPDDEFALVCTWLEDMLDSPVLLMGPDTDLDPPVCIEVVLWVFGIWIMLLALSPILPGHPLELTLLSP